MTSKIFRIIAHLDRLGATYRAVDGHPGWYEARWPDEEAPGGCSRWACRDHPDDRDRDIAQAFKHRAAEHLEAAASAPSLPTLRKEI